MKIAKEIGDQGGEGRAYGKLGNAYNTLCDYRKAMQYLEKQLKIAKEIGDQGGEGGAYGGLGNAYQSLGDYRQAIEYHEKHLKIAKEIGDQGGEGGAYGNLGVAYGSLGDYRKAMDDLKKYLRTAKELGDRAGELMAYHNIGTLHFSFGQFESAVHNFVSAMNVFISLRFFLVSEDNWKIKFRELHEITYTGLYKSLLGIGKVDEALLVAEQGRAQALSDNLIIQYKLTTSLSPASLDTKDTISHLFAELSTPTIFLALEGLTINIWFLRRKKKIVFRQGRLDGDTREKDPIRVLLEAAFKTIKREVNVSCEDRTFGELESEYPSIREVRVEKVGNLSLPPSDNPFKPFYDAVIGPIADLLQL